MLKNTTDHDDSTFFQIKKKMTTIVKKTETVDQISLCERIHKNN